MRNHTRRARLYRAALMASAVACAAVSAEASLTIDLRLTQVDGVAAGNAKSAVVSHYGQTFTFDLYATVKSATNPNDVDFRSLQGSFLSANVAGGYAALGTISPAGTLSGGPGSPRFVAIDPFAANGASTGSSKDLDGDGDLDLGDDNPSDTQGTLGYVAFRAAMTDPPTAAPGAVAVAGGKEWHIGTLTFTVGNYDAAAANKAMNAGTTNVNFAIRRGLNNAVIQQAALWAEEPGDVGVNDGLDAASGSIIFGTPVVLTRAQQWNIPTGGSWAVAGNWAGAMPNGVGAAANFLSTAGQAASIDLNGDKTVGQITFDNSNSHTIAQGTGGTLTLDNGASAAAINVVKGNHTISAPLAIAAGKTVNRTGTGDLTLSGAQNHGAGAVLNANEGKTVFAANGGTNLTVNVGDGTKSASVVFQTKQTLGGLNVKANGRASINSATKTVLDVGGLTVASGGSIELDKHALIVRNVPTAQYATKVTELENLVKAGRDGGTWNGLGLTSAAAKANELATTTIGVLNNNVDGQAFRTSFEGQTVDANSILVKYTYFGDTDLDGEITGSDYAVTDVAYWLNTPNPGWKNGDCNYDGVVDGSDYAVMDLAFWLQDAGNPQSGTAVALSASPAVVPEPGSMALLAIGAAGLLARRKRAR